MMITLQIVISVQKDYISDPELRVADANASFLQATPRCDLTSSHPDDVEKKTTQNLLNSG